MANDAQKLNIPALTDYTLLITLETIIMLLQVSWSFVYLALLYMTFNNHYFIMNQLICLDTPRHHGLWIEPYFSWALQSSHVHVWKFNFQSSVQLSQIKSYFSYIWSPQVIWSANCTYFLFHKKYNDYLVQLFAYVHQDLGKNHRL